ncbi:ATP-binding protein [Dactylosporangium sp. NPDC051485]|uniref:sensor histidine kinase n=1 Tax=Dactylosporangium sp. NPDC051485 TaxID=3154846 RepID=UPI00344A1287
MTARGTLRVYLGAAPGVGKTYKMLEEGRRRLDRGTDVVVGFVETHGRPFTEAMLDGLEVLPRRDMTYRGAAFTELDLDAVLARRPEVALIDELAHTNIPGSPHAKRWQDIERLLDAGIDVLTTVNVQHLESLNDVVESITGVPQRETVPDAIVRRAEQIELVDMTPEALRRRMAHGNIYKPEKIDAALGNYFRVGNLTALRELALLWLANKVDDQLDRYRAEHNIDKTWETRERVVVALTGGPEGDTLIRRAARIAARTKGAGLMAVHVVRGDGLAGANPANLTRQRLLVESLGGTYHQVLGSDVPGALLDFARGVNATQLVLGASRRGRLAQVLSPGVGVTTTAESGPIDVHLVTHEQARQGRLRLTRPVGGLTLRRRLLGVAVAVAGLPLLTLGLGTIHEDMSLPSDILAYLVLAVGAALVGGLLPALICAVGGFLLLNWFFTPPLYRFTVAEHENLFALVAFVGVAVAVATVVDGAARRARDAARASAEAQTLATLAGSVLHGDNPLDALLERVRESFGLTSVTLLERDAEHAPWRIAATVGGQPCTTPSDGESEVPIDDDAALVLRGHPLQAADRRLVEAFAAHAAIALRQRRLGEQAAAAGSLAEVDKLRTALLSAVSHDLRTPLASAKAAVGSLRSPDVHFSPEDTEELLATAEESLDKLTRLVENLLDMSRLQAGALAMTLQAVSVAEAVPRAIDDLGPLGAGVRVSVADDLPEVHADPALLERVLVNVLANAVRYSPPGNPPLIGISEHAGLVDVRVIDHGPGIPAADRERVFQPFQRLGDRDNATGVGLGLALSRGLAEAMGGTLTPEPTPGGGLTMTLTLPIADLADAVRADPALLTYLDHPAVGKAER